MEQHGGKGAPRRLGKNPFTLTCCLDRQRAEKCGSRLQCRILVNAARARVGTLRHFDAHAANLVAAAVKCARRATGTPTSVRAGCRSSATSQVKSDCGRTACRHSTGEPAGTYSYNEILVGRVCYSYRTIQLVPTQLKYTGLRIATETRPIHNTDDMGICVGLRTAPVAIMGEMRNARQI